jgi:hypothetical protein
MLIRAKFLDVIVRRKSLYDIDKIRENLDEVFKRSHLADNGDEGYYLEIMEESIRKILEILQYLLSK